MDFETEISKNREKNGSKNYVFFDCIFLSILGRFGKGFGTLLGGGLEPVGLCLAFFWPLFLRLCAQEVLRGPKRRPRALLDSILDGSGGVLRGVWEDPRPPNCDKTRYVENHRFDIPCRRPQEAPKSSLGLDFGWIWRGVGRGLGGFGSSKLTFFCFFLYMSLKMA